ncbi:MAG: Conserved repeat protein [Frankiales bacterium]|nr:Conserved repeat protein [Frankiales bacterium]
MLLRERAHRRGTRSERWRRRSVAGAGVAALLLSTLLAAPASAAVKEYQATRIVPVPPATSFAGQGGGDGWALAMTPRAVYNVFHHSGQLVVACHLQVDASACGAPRTVTDGSTGGQFAVSGQPGLSLDQASGRLFVYATRASDATAGVVCVDTLLAEAVVNPFCGFTPLSAVGEASNDGISGISGPLQVGSRWYAFNYVSGSTVTGTRNALLCFDLATQAACTGQPYAVGLGAGQLTNATFPAPATSLMGGRVVVPVTIDGVAQLACFDAAASAACGGSWPATVDPSYPSNYGSAYPVLSSSGAVQGLCLPTGQQDDCLTTTGAPLVPPVSLVSTMGSTTGWNGPPVVLGPRVYLASGNGDQVRCFDASTGASCTSFPRANPGASYMYTVNPDPQRPDCLWINADSGSAQIQNFDAYTAGACGQGPIRVLASSLVAPSEKCVPDRYTRLAVLSPGRAAYSSGTISFLGGGGSPLPGLADRPLDASGSVDLTGLDLTSATGLPQFLITLVGAGSTPTSLTVELDWTGDADAVCQPPQTVVVAPTHALTGQTFTLTYACTGVPTVSVTKPDGSPATGVALGLSTSGNGVDHVQGVVLSTAQSVVATLSCNGTTSTTPVFRAVAPVPGTFGPGWPQDTAGALPLTYSYGGAHRYLGNVVAGVAGWNAAGTSVQIGPAPVGTTPDLSVADVPALLDDVWGVTIGVGNSLSFGALGMSTSYTHNFVYLSQQTLDVETDAIRTKVATHEIGHALALLHPSDAGFTRATGPASVLWQGRLPYNTPQAYDVSRLQQRYP